jgi:hypothetical protein
MLVSSLVSHNRIAMLYYTMLLYCIILYCIIYYSISFYSIVFLQRLLRRRNLHREKIAAARARLRNETSYVQPEERIDQVEARTLAGQLAVMASKNQTQNEKIPVAIERVQQESALAESSAPTVEEQTQARPTLAATVAPNAPRPNQPNSSEDQAVPEKQNEREESVKVVPLPYLSQSPIEEAETSENTMSDESSVEAETPVVREALEEKNVDDMPSVEPAQLQVQETSASITTKATTVASVPASEPPAIEASKSAEPAPEQLTPSGPLLADETRSSNEDYSKEILANESQHGSSQQQAPLIAGANKDDATVATEVTADFDPMADDFPVLPMFLKDIKHEQFKRLCKKMRKNLNHDPWDEFKKYHDESVADFIEYHPATCQVRYAFDHFTCQLFPLSMLCTLGASAHTIELAYGAFEEARFECDVWIGTPLHYACSYKAEPAIVQFLTRKEPSMLGKTNQFGRTPLHMACLFKAPAKSISHLVQMFPKAAAILDKDGYTPLHLACENGASADIVQILVTSNPNNCMAVTQHDATPLHLACSSTASKLVVRILIGACPEAAEYPDYMNQLPLHLAAQSSSSAATMEILVKAYPEGIKAVTDRGQTAFRIARGKRASDDVMRLL